MVGSLNKLIHFDWLVWWPLHSIAINFFCTLWKSSRTNYSLKALKISILLLYICHDSIRQIQNNKSNHSFSLFGEGQLFCRLGINQPNIVHFYIVKPNKQTNLIVLMIQEPNLQALTNEWWLRVLLFSPLFLLLHNV